MHLYLLTFVAIAATMAAPTSEPPVTESNQQSTTPAAAAVKQKTARQLPIEQVSRYVIVSPLETSAVRKDEVALDDDESGETIDGDVIVDTQNGEMMHTAENLVFRPLFSYRKLQEKRKRLYGSKRPVTNSANTIRRTSYAVTPQRYVYSRPYYPSGYYYPY